jgi:hypothetical protein
VSYWTGDEPTLAEVQAEFSSWTCWRGTSGLYYARMPGKTDGTPDAIGEDPPDLRDMIVKAKWEQVHAEETGQAPR